MSAGSFVRFDSCVRCVSAYPQRLEANRKTRADAFYQKKKEATRLRAEAAKAVDA